MKIDSRYVLLALYGVVEEGALLDPKFYLWLYSYYPENENNDEKPEGKREKEVKHSK